MTNLEKRRADRFRFLKRLYDVTDANKFAMGSVSEIAAELGIGSDEVDNIVQYLEGKRWIEWRSMGLVSITEWGIDEIETAESGPSFVASEESQGTKQDEGFMTDRSEWSPFDPAFRPEDLEDLTGLGRRSTFDRDVERFLLASKTEEMPVACLLIDVDDFKQINDTYGHPTGDKVLRAVASMIRVVVHGKGRAYRYGGDEFIVLLFNFAAQDAKGVGDRLRKEVASRGIEGAGETISLTVGIAIHPESATDAAQLVQRADDALREGKQSGKGLTIVYGAEEAHPEPTTRPAATTEEIDQILQWFESNDPVVRTDAAKDLQRLVWRKHIFYHEPVRSAFSRLLKDPSEEVRTEALEIIRELIVTDKDAVGRYYSTPLLDVAENDPSLQVRARTMAVIGNSVDTDYLERVYNWIGTWDQRTYNGVNPIAALTGLTLSGLGEKIRNDLRALIDRASEPARSRYVEALKNVASAIR